MIISLEGGCDKYLEHVPVNNYCTRKSLLQVIVQKVDLI